MKNYLNSILWPCLLSLLFSLSPAYADKVDSLIESQKFAEALKVLQADIAEKESEKKDKEWAQLIIKEAMIKIALHGYETAVKDLRGREWPKDALPHAMVALAYSRMLQIYHESYSWEIRKRERITGKKHFDLKSMTSEEIYQEAYGGFEKVWKVREALGRYPREAMPALISPNNYPAEVRGTLRDTLSYIIVGFLSDSSGWAPGISQTTHTLSPEELLTGKEKVSFSDQEIHPLIKISYVLKDLETWHRARGRKEAALEARLKLHEILWHHLSSLTSRKNIKASLKEVVSEEKSNPWVSMAYGTLSDFSKEELDLKEALKLAIQGSELFPKSPGAAKCRDNISEIKRPFLSLEGMNIDTNSRKSLGVKYKNLTQIYFRSYSIDFKKFISKTKDYSLRPGWRELEEILKGKPTYTWKSSLPETTDYKQHRIFLTPPEHKPGFYAIMASTSPSFREGLMQGLEIFISDYVFQLTRNHPRQEFLLQALRGSNGQPVKDAKVSFYSANYQTGHKLQSEGKTDGEGFAKFPVKSEKNRHNAYFFVLEKDGHIVGSRNPESMYAPGKSDPKTSDTFIYLDRSIYRPGQKVLWKIVAYHGDLEKKSYQVEKDQVITVNLLDANRETVAKTSVKTNSFGSASGEFTIPTGKLLGSWSISTSHGGGVSLRVEEYKRPTFLVEFDDKANELRLNKDAVVKGRARYYFGLPLSKGFVGWTIHRQAILPWWCFWGSWSWGGLNSNELIASGKSPVNDEGVFEIKFKPTADEDISDLKQITYNYQIKADVTDEGGETQSASISEMIGFTSVKAALTPDENFFLAGKKGSFSIVRTDLNGRATPGKGTWKLVRLKNPERTLTPSEIPVPETLLKLAKDQLIFPDDMNQPRWAPEYRYELYLREWKEEAVVATGDALHGKDGKFLLGLPSLNEGVYRLRYKTKDSFNSVYEDQKEFLVVDKMTNVALPGLLLVQKSSVEAGEKILVYAGSGFKDQRMVFETFRFGVKVSSRVLTAGKDSSLIEVPVENEDRGGLGITLTILNEFQDVRFSEYVMVPWSNKLVDVEFSTMREKLRPGSRETWSIKIKGKDGRKIGAETFELLTYMYDQSLDSFGPHSPPTPVRIYPTSGGTVFPDSELGAGTQVYTIFSHIPYSNEFGGFTPDHVKFYPNYGVGGPGQRGARGLRMKTSRMGDSAVPAGALFESTAAMDADMSVASAPLVDKGSASEGKTEMRSNFAETAFWKPHLVPGKDGSVEFKFTVPDSVTSWNIWAHAVSRDLQSGSVQKEARTVKDLMIRPYLPRFFREGDEATIKVVINNSSEQLLKGNANVEILDEAGKKSLAKEFALEEKMIPFSVKALGSTTISVPVKIPAGPKNIVIKTIARSGNISDGETRPVPVLPGRMHLAESKFVTLINRDKAQLTFPGLAKTSDKSLVNDLFVVTLDAQLFYSVLSSLPYLINYPYQCTEQMLNSFVSSGIVSSVFNEFPELGKMAKELSSRKTRLEKWDDEDPNRKLTLEEAPWLNLAKGGMNSEDTELITLLHPDIAKNTRDKYLKLLKDSQTGSGGFPWFSGGPPSPWMTMYLLYGFSKAIEFKVDVPKEMISKAWSYLHQHYVNEIVRDLMAKDVGWETVTFLNYVLSSYPDSSWTGNVFTEAERTAMMNFSMKHWKSHSPYLKSYLALALVRAKRTEDAKLVWDSVMDSAKSSKDEGTHWAQEDRSWLWYNDTIETHALALRTGSELGTRKEVLDGLVQWLFLNKKLNHWKSTRATSEVIYSLTHYLKKTKQLGVTEKISVSMDGKTTNFVFDPSRYSGKKNQIVIPGKDVSSSVVPVTIEKTTPGLAFASATWHYSTEKLPKKSVGDFFHIGRKYFRRVATKSGMNLIPVNEGDEISIGDEVEVQLSLSSKHPSEYVHLRDPRPSGFEPVDQVSRHKWELGIYWYEEIRDSGTNFFFERLPYGQYNFRYRIRASMSGKFRAAPAMIQPLYAPEFVGFSEGHELTIKE